MDDSNLRFRAPLTMARPRGARLLEAFSPKLGRRIRVFDYAALDVWISLEADPDVLALCERPIRTGPAPDSPLLDFWVRRQGDEELLGILRDGVPGALPDQLSGISVRWISDTERAVEEIWVGNWQRMLPVVCATRAQISSSLIHSVARFVGEPTPLGAIEAAFAQEEPTVVRGTVFELLRTGRLRAPSLRTRPLTFRTNVEPTA
jgi:hypothetical protein